MHDDKELIEAQMNGEPLVRWRRDPLHQTKTQDVNTRIMTYARACTASKDYVIVRINGGSLQDWSGCKSLEEARRFVDHNITPQEAIHGQDAPDVDRSR